MKNFRSQIDRIKISRISFVLLVLFFGLIISGFSQDASKDPAKEKANKTGTAVLSSVYKEIEGEVSAVNKSGVAVILKRDLAKGEENEIYIPFEKSKLRIIHKRNLDEIKVGDIVKVGYQIINEETKLGSQSRFDAQTITFLKPAEKKPLPVEPSAEVTDDSEGETLPLKGVRQ